MELSELIAFAQEKYKIDEEHKWSDFPGFSVLCHPATGKWVALLMRQWDTESGTEIQRCDLKCGAQVLRETDKPYLSPAIRMRGPNWVGVAFDGRTEAEVVFRLFDQALSREGPWGCTIVLDETAAESRETYRDTPLPFGKGLTRGFPKTEPQPQGASPDRELPDKIQEMLRLYRYGGSALPQKAENFYRQGKLMEDYEDDAPWEGNFRCYYPTYHDLNVRQLRGYFTWRSHIRQGDFRHTATSLAYIYVYELLNGIGTTSPEDALDKLWAFEKGYLDSGIGSPGMRRNLRKWMGEFAIVHGLPPETAARYADPGMLERDAALAALKTPERYTDDALFSALCTFAGKTLAQSPVVEKDAGKAAHLFAAVWRHLSAQYHGSGKDLFTACFGERLPYRWYPLSNAVYYDGHAPRHADFILNECRSYHCRSGIWQEERYESLYFDKALFQGVIHAADRMLRKQYKTGRYLREKPEEAWLTPYIAAVLEAERLAETEARRPKITIDFSTLTQIRQEALVTRDSLLTEEETGEAEEPVPEKAAEPPQVTFAGLDALHLQVLTALLEGQDPEALIRDRRLMPSVVTDTINEALFDEVGDNVLSCDGEHVTLVDDYREDVIEVLGGGAHE